MAKSAKTLVSFEESYYICMDMNKPIDYTINVRGRLIDLSKPKVMGILNVTPDSFFSGSRKQTEQEIAERANAIIEEGGTFIDVGAFSTRPGALEVSEEEEARRLKWALEIVRREQPDAAVSVDTYRPIVARKCIEEWGADIINDVSEGGLTGIVNTPINESGNMFQLVGELKVPYILMSVKSNIKDMLKAFAAEVQQLRDYGAKDIILDPGYGFGKTLDDNYQILSEAEKLLALNLPILVGISRKSMIFKLVGGSPDTSLTGTVAINTMSLMKGAGILRVHDVKDAVDTVAVVEKMRAMQEQALYHARIENNQTNCNTMFFDFGVKDIIDIVLVALMLYYIYRLMKESRSLNVFIGIIVFVVVWLFVSQVIEMRLLGSIMDKLVSVGVIGLIVLFQEEIRKFLYSLGTHQRMRSIFKLFANKSGEDIEEDKETIMPIVLACMDMSKNKVGALIVIERAIPLDDIVNTGDLIDARINQRLIENIFFKNSPLHDGAMIISKKRIKSAGCILPVSHSLDIPKDLGLRHRAAMGISQDSDAIAVIVSEETGRISVAIKGEFRLRLSAEELESVLAREMA